MVVKPGYRQTEVGVIPEEWKIQPIIACCEYADYRGKTPPKTQYGIFLVTARNVRMGYIDYKESQEFVPSELYEQIMRRGKPQIGDVLITTEAPLGNVAQVDREDVALAQRIIKYRPKTSDLSSAYLKHYFLSGRFQLILNNHSSGSTARGIKGSILHQLPVVIPRPIEQRAIADALSDVDLLLGVLDRLIVKKRDLKQAAMQQLLTGKTRLPGFHGEWEVKRLGELAHIQRGASPRPIDNPIWFDENSSIGWVRISDVSRSGMYLCETVQRLSLLGIQQSRPVARGSLIMSICATVGRPIITEIDVCIHDGFVVFDNLQAEKLFMYYILKWIEPDWSKHGQTGSQMNLNTGLISGTPVRVPSPPEQAAIAAILSNMDAEITALEQRRDKTRALKQAMMQELLTGKTRLVSPGDSHA
jgi:type I restriction enzyme S subunit